jgi:hypothetical protein
MNVERRVVVLVLAVDRDPWRSIERRGQRATWASAPGVLFLHGETRSVRRLAIGAAARTPWREAVFRRLGARVERRPVTRVGDEIRTGVPELYGLIGTKLRAGLRHLVATEDFDYLLRVSTSTYVDVAKLRARVNKLPATGCYAGFLGEYGGVRYVSGSGMLLSRELVELGASAPEWDHALVDDVALGRVMAANGVVPVALSRIDVPTIEAAAALRPDDLADAFLVRCKSSGFRSDDICIMRRIHELVTA